MEEFAIGFFGFVAVFALVFGVLTAAEDNDNGSTSPRGYLQIQCAQAHGRWVEVYGVNNDMCIVGDRVVKF